MSAYVSLYRKYRPQRFGDLVGQGHITRILQNALAGGRVAHAYLFCGPRGTGKTTTARLLAKALNCASGPGRDPCGACPACERIAAGSALDVIEIDAASNRGIDDIRELRDKVKYAPAEARYKVYVVDECHMLTTEAFNALLKTLEEPPPHVLFILATTDPQKVPATILSRCQRLDFRRGSVADLVARLKVVAAEEELDVEEEALVLIARSADGSWRDALGILEQIVAFGARRVTAEDVRAILGTVSADLLSDCAEAVAAADAARALQIVARLAEEGKDIRDFLRGLVAHFRNLLLVGASGGRVLPDGATADETRVLTDQAGRFRPATCIRAIGALSDAEKEMRRDSQHRLLLEIALLRLTARPAAAPSESEREARVGGPVPQAAEPSGRPEAPAASAPAAAPAAAPASQRPPVRPEPAARPAPPAAAGMSDLAAAWPLVIERVKNMRLRGILRDVRPVPTEGGGVVLRIRPGYNFHRDQLEKPENLRSVQDALREVLGAEVTARVRMEEAGAESTGEAALPSVETAPASEAPSRVAEEPNPYDADTVSVKDVLDLFQGRIL